MKKPQCNLLDWEQIKPLILKTKTGELVQNENFAAVACPKLINQFFNHNEAPAIILPKFHAEFASEFDESDIEQKNELIKY